MIDVRQTQTAPPPVVKTFYPYQPSVAAAGVFCALFGIGFLLSVWQTIRHRAWIWSVMVLAIGMEAVGYGARVFSAIDTSARTIFIVQFCLIILAPVLMAGVIYVVFGRIVFLVVPAEHRTVRLLWVPARWLTPIFVGFDIFALFLQLVGAVMVSGTQPTDNDAANKLQRGKDVALVGVTLQIVAFGLFTFVAARFHFTSQRFKSGLERRFRAVPGDKFVTLEGSNRKFKPNWRAILYVVNISCVLILIRSVYREVDFAEGKGSDMSHYEYFPYVLDAAPMFLVVLLYTLCPPGAYISMGWRQPKEETAPRGVVDSDVEGFVMAPPPQQPYQHQH